MAADDDMRKLADEMAIRRLMAFYSDAVTQLDAHRAASVYAEDGCVSIVGSETQGRDAIEQGMRESFAAHQLLQMIEHGGLVEVSGDEAWARWSTIEVTVRRGAEAFNVIFGRYEDQLVRLPAGWRFRKRVFTMAGRTQLETKRMQLNPAFFGALARDFAIG